MARISRRDTLVGVGALGAAAFAAPADAVEAPAGLGRLHPEIAARVAAAPLVDTHEHLIEEQQRLAGTSNRFVRADDWSMLLSHYLDADLRVAGMSQEDYDRFFSPQTDPLDKWALIAPYWPAVKQTGYAQAVRIAARKLYDVDDVSADQVAKLQDGYDRLRRPGFYERVLRDHARIESCQVNSLAAPFSESPQPTLLMQDLSILGMHAGPSVATFAPPTGIDVRSLDDWHRVIDWWFDRYGPYAVATKTQNAYSRDIDFQQVSAEAAAPLMTRRLGGETLSAEEQRALEDHLFWYAVGKSTQAGLPVKLHTGYYAGHGSMPLRRLARNAGSACDLCRAAPETSFVFMHIGYPYYEEWLALAKHYPNAYLDMCWAWIINPLASKDFLKKLLVTVPSNKVFTFGGDYIPVEPVAGHAELARHGVALALTELVDEGWISLADALELVDPLLHGNARRAFRLPEKQQRLAQAPWL